MLICLRFSWAQRTLPYPACPPMYSTALAAYRARGCRCGARLAVRSGGLATAGRHDWRGIAAQPQQPGKWGLRVSCLHPYNCPLALPLLLLLLLPRGLLTHTDRPLAPRLPLLLQSSGLRDRLAALSRRYSSTTLEQAQVAAAAAEAAAEGPAGVEIEGPAAVLEAAEEEADASLMAAAAAAGATGSMASPARSVGSTQVGGETPSRFVGSAGTAMARSPAAPSPAAAPQDLPVGSRWAGQPEADVAERMDAILADLQQRLGSLEAAAATATAATATVVAPGEAQPAAEGPCLAPACADAATQTAAAELQAAQTAELPAGPSMDACFLAEPPQLPSAVLAGPPARFASAGTVMHGWWAALQARWVARLLLVW